MKKIRLIIVAVLRYFKNDILSIGRVGLYVRKKFHYFGRNSLIIRPIKQIKDPQKIFIEESNTIQVNARMAVYGTSQQEKAIIHIGNHCYIGSDFTVLASDEANVFIGDHVVIASYVLITNENHGINPESQTPYIDQPLTAKDVYIGDGCWIGEKACILPGVYIGKKVSLEQAVLSQNRYPNIP